MTWPTATRTTTTTKSLSAHNLATNTMSATLPKTSTLNLPTDDLEDHPENHFLSPIYDYEEWDSDDDDDGSDVEWSAGITDFALFDDDRRKALDKGDELPSQWNDFVSSQASALDRALERERAASLPDTTRPPLPFEGYGEMPGLTPDCSPNLRGDLDVSSDSVTRQSAPNYLTITLTPPSKTDRMIEDDEDLPLSFHYRRTGEQKYRAPRRLQRPGLGHSRTMSKKLHVWRRPSWNIYSVGEDKEAEERAEMDA